MFRSVTIHYIDTAFWCKRKSHDAMIASFNQFNVRRSDWCTSLVSQFASALIISKCSTCNKYSLTKVMDQIIAHIIIMDENLLTGVKGNGKILNYQQSLKFGRHICLCSNLEVKLLFSFAFSRPKRRKMLNPYIVMFLIQRTIFRCNPQQVNNPDRKHYFNALEYRIS